MNNLKIKDLQEKFNKVQDECKAKCNEVEKKYNEVNNLIKSKIDLFRNDLNKCRYFCFFELTSSKFNQFKTAEQNHNLKEEMLDVITSIKVRVEGLYSEIDLMLDEFFLPANDLHYQTEDLEEEKEEILEQIEDEKEILNHV